MNAVTSTLGRVLYAVAFAALHVLVAVVVLFYAVGVGLANLVRLCGGLFRRSGPRRGSPAVIVVGK